MRDDGHPANSLPAALVLMQLVGGACFVLLWVLRALVFGVTNDGRAAGEPLQARAPDARNADAGSAAPDRRPRQEPVRPAGEGQSSSGQQGGTRPRRRTSAPEATRSAREPDDPRKRSHAPSRSPSTARRRSEAERSALSVGSAAANDSRSGTSRDAPRRARPSGAMEMPTARGDPNASGAALPGTPPRRTEAPSQASMAQQPGLRPTSATMRMPAVGPPVVGRYADDSSDGDDGRFVTRPRPDAAAGFIEAVAAIDNTVIAGYAQRFRDREREGWVQNPRDPAAGPTPSALRAQRMRARTNAGTIT